MSVIARVTSTKRLVLQDSGTYFVVVVSPNSEVGDTFSTDAAGIVAASNNLTPELVESLWIHQTDPDIIRVEILDEETEEGQHAALIGRLRELFHAV